MEGVEIVNCYFCDSSEASISVEVIPYGEPETSEKWEEVFACDTCADLLGTNENE